MKKLILAFCLAATSIVSADTYLVDTKGAHAAVHFKISHLGYSWLYGRFDDFSGEFVFDEKDPSAASIKMTVETNSVNSNHVERDKHLRSDDFLNVAKFPTASFESTQFTPGKDGHGTMQGKLTLNGVTQLISLEVEFVGAGEDPWGGYRRGYEATTELKLSDFNIKKSDATLWLTVAVEGIKQ